MEKLKTSGRINVKEIEIKDINGAYKRHRSGVFVPSEESLLRVLEKAKIDPDERIPYVPQGNEVEDATILKNIQMPILLVGPTGVGKSMFARYMAQRWGLPFLWITCDPDKTEAKLVGRSDLLHVNVEVGGEVQGMLLQIFRPSLISTAGLSEEPVVLFIDELHKLRKDMDSLFHPVINERYVNISDHLGPGAVYKLHPETVVMFALNPYYEGGIEKIGIAMRQRLATLRFQMVTSEARLFNIVRANVGNIDSAVEPTIRKICDMCASICRIYYEYKEGGRANNSDDIMISADLKSVLPMLIEAPSPRLVVNASRAILGGMKPSNATKIIIFDAIANDDETINALVAMANSRFGL